MERYCPPGIVRFVPANKISPKFKRVHESFLSQNIFRDSKKIFCDLFVRMELENEKTETRHHFCIRGGGGGGYSTDAWVGRCSPGVQTLTLFKKQFSDFPIPFKTEFKIFRPYLRH